MTTPYQVTADHLISLCNLGKMDNSLHQTIWSKLDAHTDILDLANICVALSVSANTHGTLVCQSYIHGVLNSVVDRCMRPLLKAGHIEQFNLLVEYMSQWHAIEVFECAIEQKYWKGALCVFLKHLTIEDWSEHEKCFAVGNLIGRTLKRLNCVDVSKHPHLDLISELENRALKNILEECVGETAAHSLRKKM